jgi:hypothetical protein
VLRPISNSSAIFQILSILDENESSVVHNDMGELIFTNNRDTIDNMTYECTRRICTNTNEYKCEYILDLHGETITISQPKNSTIYEVKLPETWTDKDSKIITTSDKWVKDKVLTYNELMKIMKSYKNSNEN